MRRIRRRRTQVEKEPAAIGWLEWLKRHKKLTAAIAAALIWLGSCDTEIGNRTYRGLAEARPCDTAENPWTFSFPDLEDRQHIAESVAFLQVFAKGEISTPAKGEVRTLWGVEINDEQDTILVTFTNAFPYDYGADGTKISLWNRVTVSLPENLLGEVTKLIKLKVNDHWLDFETSFVKMERQADGSWRVTKLIFLRHGKETVIDLKLRSDQEKENVTCVFGDQLVVYIAKYKHTTYENLLACNETPFLVRGPLVVEPQTCSIGDRVPMIILPEYDLGVLAVTTELEPEERLIALSFGNDEEIDSDEVIKLDPLSRCPTRVYDEKCLVRLNTRDAQKWLKDEQVDPVR